MSEEQTEAQLYWEGIAYSDARSILYRLAVATGEAGWGCTILQNALVHLGDDGDRIGESSVAAWCASE